MTWMTQLRQALLVSFTWSAWCGCCSSCCRCSCCSRRRPTKTMTVSCSKKVPEWVNITTRYLANAKQATGPQNLENLFPSLFQSTDKINRVTSHNYLFPSNFGFHHASSPAVAKQAKFPAGLYSQQWICQVQDLENSIIFKCGPFAPPNA